MAHDVHRTELEARLVPQDAPRWERSEPLSIEQVRRLFDSRFAHTIGIEEELMLLDPETLELSPSVARALDLVADDDRFTCELREGQLEVRTPVCGNAVAAGICLAEARLRLDHVLGGRLRIASAGTHPFSSAWGPVTDGDRYRQIAEEYPHAVSGNLPSGLHVHVAVPGAERALAVFNAARSFLPELTALSANSPFLDGVDTGLASARNRLTIAFHRSGVPPAFATWQEFVEFVEWGRTGGLLPDASHVWWDLRPHVGHGTIELRSPDAQSRVEDAVAVAAVFQALLAWLSERFDGGEELPVHESGRIAENVWRAARYGPHGWMVDHETGEQVETRTRISRLLAALEPVAGRLGLGWPLLTAHALLADNGADRQRYVARQSDLRSVMRRLTAETVDSAREYLERRV